MGLSSRLSVSLVIPTLNEERAIGKVLREVPKGSVEEVVVVDSSKDNTAAIARAFGARTIFEGRRGYGSALRTGAKLSRGDIVVFMDGDYTYDPSEIPRLIEPIQEGKCDIAVGSRLRGSLRSGSMNPINRYGNLVLSLTFSLLFMKIVSDTQSGFRAVHRSWLERLDYENDGMGSAIEQIIKLVKQGARVTEVPVSYRPRIGQTKLCRLTDGIKILQVILKERFNPTHPSPSIPV